MKINPYLFFKGNCEEAFKAAIQKRHAIGRRLLAALENRGSWPDPDLGRR